MAPGLRGALLRRPRGASWLLKRPEGPPITDVSGAAEARSLGPQKRHILYNYAFPQVSFNCEPMSKATKGTSTLFPQVSR